jgi:hypothetical protein
VTAVLGLSGPPAFGQGHTPAPVCPTPYPPAYGAAPGAAPAEAAPEGYGGGAGFATGAPAGLAAFGAESGAAVGGGTVGLQVPNAGYIDSAIPFTNFRLRYDSAYGDNRPDRAEFFYAKCGCFRPVDPNAPGPRLPETNVDYQDIRSYLEVAFADRFSVFAEVPVRFLNPDQNANTAGLADMYAGFKAALLYDPRRVLSFQLRTWIPTGAASHGLGTNHVSLEPALLLYQKLSDRLLFEGQLADWIPIGGTDFSGNIIDYGMALSYFVVNNENFRVAPVAEVLGWTLLGGKELAFPENVVISSSGETIVNGKVGVRIGFGPATQPGYISGSSIYIGYSRALTGDVWYKNMLRLEYRMRF